MEPKTTNDERSGNEGRRPTREESERVEKQQREAQERVNRQDPGEPNQLPDDVEGWGR